LGAEDKKTEVREYSIKHQGLGVAQVDASALRIRALQLLDNNLESMIRHKPNAKACRVVELQLKTTNMKKQILHVRNEIVYITNQTRRGFIDDPDDYAFKEGMPGQTTGHTHIALRGENTLATHGGRIWNESPALRLALRKHEAKWAAKALARAAPL
jgi:hypothetical protein